MTKTEDRKRMTSCQDTAGHKLNIEHQKGLQIWRGGGGRTVERWSISGVIKAIENVKKMTDDEKKLSRESDI